MYTVAIQDLREKRDQEIAALISATIERLRDLGVNSSRAVQTWVRRSNQRSALTRLNNRMLTDIGLTRADLDRETRKYFWQK